MNRINRILDIFGRIRDAWELLPAPVRNVANGAVGLAITAVLGILAIFFGILLEIPWYWAVLFGAAIFAVAWVLLVVGAVTWQWLKGRIVAVHIEALPCPSGGFSYGRASEPHFMDKVECYAMIRVTSARRLTNCSVKVLSIDVALEERQDEWARESQFGERYLCWAPESSDPSKQRYATIRPGRTGELFAAAVRGQDGDGLYFEIVSADEAPRKKFPFGASYRITMRISADELPEKEFVSWLGFALRLRPPAPLNLRILKQP